MWCILTIFLVVNHQVLGLTVDELNVVTPFGVLKGEERGHYTAFEGIPYAEPPIGELRFEPPVPWQTEWEGVREAVKPGPHCLQWDHLELDKEDRLTGDEDCLYLNIYTPKGISKDEKHPVIFFIHGGALMFGYGEFNGPQYLTTRPLILVTFNYRLGPLGFLTSGDQLIPGNMGMKDQVAALRWVNDHISLFGGDPKKITITGFSAGGASVHLHYLSELSSGLFNNGISHSGTALEPWVMQQQPVEKFHRVSELVGCDQFKTSAEVVNCLKSKPGADIVRTVPKFQPFLYSPCQIFGVVVDKQSDQPFLTDTPKNLIENDKMANKPWILGETKDEGLYPAAELLRKPEYLPNVNENWTTIAPYMLFYHDRLPEDQVAVVSQKIRENYLGDKPITEENFRRFVDIFTDRLFHVGCNRAARLCGNKVPMYVYYYNSKLTVGVGEILSGRKSDQLGVAHGDDVLLLYYVEAAAQQPFTDSEKAMQGLLLDFYQEYAYNGVARFGNLAMPRTESPDTVTYTLINSPTDIKAQTYDNIGNHKFWSTIPFNES